MSGKLSQSRVIIAHCGNGESQVRIVPSGQKCFGMHGQWACVYTRRGGEIECTCEWAVPLQPPELSHHCHLCLEFRFPNPQAAAAADGPAAQHAFVPTGLAEHEQWCTMCKNFRDQRQWGLRILIGSIGFPARQNGDFGRNFTYFPPVSVLSRYAISEFKFFKFYLCTSFI